MVGQFPLSCASRGWDSRVDGSILSRIRFHVRANRVRIYSIYIRKPVLRLKVYAYPCDTLYARAHKPTIRRHTVKTQPVGPFAFSSFFHFPILHLSSHGQYPTTPRDLGGSRKSFPIAQRIFVFWKKIRWKEIPVNANNANKFTVS